VNSNQSAQPSKVPEPKRRFRLQKLEERIAPKGPPFSKRTCNSF
jgi:hypothetical protein